MRFEESVAGRLLTLAVALPLATGALTSWGPGGSGMVWIMGSVFAAIVMGIVGVGLAVDEFDREAVTAVLVLPPALFLYTPLVGIAASVGAVRVAMGLVACVLFANAWHVTFSAPRHAAPRHAVHSA